MINWFKHRLPTIYRGCKNFLRNIYVFRKTLWNHYRFDYGGTLHAIRDSLDDVQKFMETDKAWGVEANKKAKDMRKIIMILDRVIEDEYGIRYFDYEWRELGKVHHEGYGELTRTEIEVIKLKDLPTKELERISNFRQNEWQLVCKALERKLFTWWD